MMQARINLVRSAEQAQISFLFDNNRLFKNEKKEFAKCFFTED